MADAPEIKSDKDQPSKLTRLSEEQNIVDEGLSLLRISAPEPELKVGVAKPSETILGEGLYSAAYSLHSVGKGVLQLGGMEDIIGDMDIPAPSEFGSSRWHAQQIGGAAGIIAPFLLTHKAVKFAGEKVAPTKLGASMAKYLNTPGKVAVAEGAIAGGTFEFLAKPTGEGDDIWTRPKNFVVGAATFGPMTAATIGIKSYGSTLSRPFAQKLVGNNITAATLSGAPAGAMHTFSHDVMFKGTDFSKYSTTADYGKNMYTFGVVGLGLGLKDAGVAKIKQYTGIESPTFHQLVDQGKQNREANDNLLSGVRTARSTELIDLTRPEPVKTSEVNQLEASTGRQSIAREPLSLTEKILGERPSNGDLSNTVLAGSDGAKTGETFKVFDVPQEIAPKVREGFELALQSAKDGAPEKFLDFAGDPANAPAAKFIIEAAHVKNDPALIDLVNRTYQLPEEVSGALRGEALAKAASQPDAASSVKDAFREWAQTTGKDSGHDLVRMGQELGKPELVNLAVEVYRGVEGSPLAKELAMGESINQLAAKYVEKYQRPGVETDPQTVRLATEAVTGRLRRQVDPSQSQTAESFDFAKYDTRLAELDRGLELLTDPQSRGTEVDAAVLGKFANGDGAKVGKALLEWAYTVDNPQMVKALEKAYGFDYNQSHIIEGEALARSSFNPDAPQVLRDRFIDYAQKVGQEAGEYLLDQAVKTNDPIMEHAVILGYAHAPNSRLGSLMMKGVELVDAAMSKSPEGAEQSKNIGYDAQATQSLVEYAAGEGAHLGRAIEKLATLDSQTDPRAVTTLREAYLFTQGGNVRDVGTAQFKDLKHDVDVMEPFFNLVARVPSTPAEYAAFKGQIIDFIARNRREITDPNQPDRARETGYSVETDPASPNYGKNIFEIIADQTAHSSVAGPIDFYFRTEHGLSNFPQTRARELPFSEIAVGSESAPRSQEYKVDELFPEFVNASSGSKLQKAHELTDLMGGMSARQFREWLAFGQSKTPGSELTNLDNMGIVGAKVLNRPELVDAVNSDPAGDGILNGYRKILVGRSGQQSVEPVPDWLNQHISMKVAVSRARLGGDATAAEVLKDAIPGWLVESVAGQRVTPAKDGFVQYGDLNADLVTLLEGVRSSNRSQFDGMTKPADAGKPETLQDRFKRLDNLLSIEGPGGKELSQKLIKLAGDDPAKLDQITFRLNPERSAPEFRELIDIVSENARSIDDVALLMKTINEGNNLNRAANPKDRGHRPGITQRDVEVNQELAILLVNQMVSPSSGNHGRALELADGLITGRYRPPRRGGDFGGKPGGGKPGGKPRGRSQDEGDGRRSPRQ